MGLESEQRNKLLQDFLHLQQQASLFQSEIERVKQLEEEEEELQKAEEEINEQNDLSFAVDKEETFNEISGVERWFHDGSEHDNILENLRRKNNNTNTTTGNSSQASNGGSPLVVSKKGSYSGSTSPGASKKGIVLLLST